MINRNQFESVLTTHWSERLNIPQEMFARPGTSVRCPETFRGEKEVYLHRLGERVVARFDPELRGIVDLVDGQELPKPLAFDDLAQHVSPGHTVRLDGRGLYRYLVADDFRPCTGTDRGELRQLRLPDDIDLVRGLTGRCPTDDVEEAEIEEERPDDILYGILVDGEMVAYGGFRYWHKRFADIGVLTDPQWRGKGLGKRVVSAVTRWCLDHDVIPLYRAEEKNTHSWRIAESLGFKARVTAVNATVLTE